MNSKDAGYSLFLLVGAVAFSIFVVVCGFRQKDEYFLPELNEHSFPELNKAAYQKENIYTQDFKTETAAVVRRKIASTKWTNASAFILDKQRGWFAVAAHFIGNGRRIYFTLFFNGRVYKSTSLKVSSRADVAIIKIVGDFDSDNFPEPYKFASGTFVGEKVRLRGFHLHPSDSWENKRLTGIFRQYYGDNSHGEIVFDDLSAYVVRVNASLVLPATPDRIEVSNLSASNCIELRLEEEHQSSFGGLSGGAIVNMNNELVGIDFASDSGGGYYVREEGCPPKYIFGKMIYAVPAEELKNLKLSQLLAEQPITFQGLVRRGMFMYKTILEK